MEKTAKAEFIMVMANSLQKLLITAAVLLGIGCSASQETQENTLWGAGVGTVVGAGAGAAVGATIANGDIAMSALLGGAVGLPVGIVVGLAYQSVKENKQIKANASQIRGNQARIRQTQSQLDTYREKLDMDTAEITPDESEAEYRYEGPSLGNYYR